MAKKNNINTTIIGHDIHIKGEVQALGPIHVDGRVEGSIVSKNHITIGELAVVKADLTANEIVVDGEVHGNVEAYEGIKINSTGKVFGNITGDRMIIEEGGLYQGNVNMDVIASQNMYEGHFEFRP